MGGSPAFARENLPPAAAALYVQIREAHVLGGWDNGGPIVATRDHGCDADRRAACALRPPALRWMPAVCDRMDDAFSRTYGAWPTSFLVFRRPGRSGAAADLVFRSRPRAAEVDPVEALDALWDCVGGRAAAAAAAAAAGNPTPGPSAV